VSERPAKADDLRRAVAALVHDPSDDGDPPLEWDIRPEGEGASRSRAVVLEPGRYWTVIFEPDGWGCSVDLLAPMALNQFFLGDVLQDSVIEETKEARPRCPKHAHPLNLHDEGYWFCPSDHDLRCPFGEYWEWRKSKTCGDG
jgi:hypothetical protein